jgi:hypothetical protein
VEELERSRPEAATAFNIVLRTTMQTKHNSLSRIAKSLIDQHDMLLDEAREELRKFRINIFCGPQINKSPALQCAVLTAVNAANRCFPGGVQVYGVGNCPILVPWRRGATGLSEALIEIAGRNVINSGLMPIDKTPTIAFGDCGTSAFGVQATFDGWTCAVSPISERVRLPEREGCNLAGVAAGSLAVSEIFLGNFGFAIEAGSRVVGLSLWRPDLPWDDTTAAGIEYHAIYLPRDAWLIGLGHLGQAYVWSLSLLPFEKPAIVDILLQDYDRIGEENMDTGLVTKQSDIGRFKTHVVANYLEERGFFPRIIDRPFNESTRPNDNEPRVALVGMDGKGPHHLLDQTGFDMAINCGLGGTASSFDSIALDVVPNLAKQTAEHLWPKEDQQTSARQSAMAEQLASKRRVYKDFQAQNGCGHIELAGQAVAVPFVGSIASTLLLSEYIRRIGSGPRFDRIRIQLSLPQECKTRRMPDDAARARLKFAPAK